jgi:hypothetical protein
LLAPLVSLLMKPLALVAPFVTQQTEDGALLFPGQA